MRTVLGGAAAGLLAGVGAATILTWTGSSVDQAAAAGVAAAAVCAGVVWAGSALRRGWAVIAQRRARSDRRRELDASRARHPTRRYGLDFDPQPSPTEDDETVMMGGKTRARLSGKHVDELLEKARAASAAGDFHRAAALYSDVLDGRPDHEEAHLARGRIHLDLGDYVRAMSDFVVAEDLAPDSPLPLVAIGDLHFARKDYVQAIACYDIALSIAPQHAMAWCRRGVSHSYRDEPALALADLLHARQLDPDIPNLDAHLAQARKKAGPDQPRGRKKR